MDGLWNHTRNFLRTLNQSNGFSGRLPGMVVKENLATFSKWKEGRVIYNNFELSRLSLWKTPLWKDFMHSVDASGMVYTRRWGDAPLHTIFVLLGVPLRQVHAFTDVAYRHDPFVHQPPAGLPMPGANPFTIRPHGCSYYSGWRCSALNGTNASVFTYGADNGHLPSGPLSPLWGSDRSASTVLMSAGATVGAVLGGGFPTADHSRINRRHSNRRGNKNKGDESHSAMNTTSNTATSVPRKWWLRGPAGSSPKDVINRVYTHAEKREVSVEKGVMYTFGHGDRVDYLAGALIAYFHH